MQCMSAAGFIRLNLESHNHFDNIFRVFDVLPSFPFATSERMWENYLQVLQFFTSNPWGVLPSTNFIDFANNCQRSLNFSFFHFFYFLCPGILKNRFFSQFLLFFSSLSCFIFKSTFRLFVFSYYSVLSASSLCSVTIQSVIFQLFIIF